MNIFTDTGGHYRPSLVPRSFTVVHRLNKEVTFSETEDVSAEKGNVQSAMFGHEDAAKPVIVVLISQVHTLGSGGVFNMLNTDNMAYDSLKQIMSESSAVLE